jgi:hypothetical protein
MHDGGIECHDTDRRALQTERRVAKRLVDHERSWTKKPPGP